MVCHSVQIISSPTATKIINPGGCLNLPRWWNPLTCVLTDESQSIHFAIGKKYEKIQWFISINGIITLGRRCKFVAILLQIRANLSAAPLRKQTHYFVALIPPKSIRQLHKHMCLAERSLSVSVISL